jgi:hypothetical protein
MNRRRRHYWRQRYGRLIQIINLGFHSSYGRVPSGFLGAAASLDHVQNAGLW